MKLNFNKYELMYRTIELLYFKTYNLFAYLIHITRLLFDHNLRKELKKINSLRNVVIDGSNATVFGNGPSINQINLEEIVSDNLFVVNYFHKHELFHEINPGHYVIIDDAFASGSFEEETYKVLFEWIKLNYKSKLYIPYRARKIVLSYIGFIPENVFLIDNYSIFTDKSLFSNKHSIYFRTVNVIPYSILLSFHLGFKNISLFGLDYGKAGHFYKSNSVHSAITINTIRLDQAWFYTSLLMRNYYKIKEYADKHQIQIINKSPDKSLTPFFGGKS